MLKFKNTLNLDTKTIHVPQKVTDFLVSGEHFNLKYDPNKKCYYTDPLPKDLSLYYKSDQYISHTDENKNAISFLYQQVKKITLAQKVKKISKFGVKKGHLLDVGAGTGDFLSKAKQKDWHVTGVEPNSKARDLAALKGLQLHANLEEIQEQKFDIITLWHVLEHIPNLEETLQTLEKLLKKDGVLVIAVPNFKSYDAQYYQKFWAAYDVPRHVWHFSKASFNYIMPKSFNLVKIDPMLFDSFYVSLLSEKYKTNKNNFFKAFFIGLLSNLKAIRTKEYSSLVYYFKKTK